MVSVKKRNPLFNLTNLTSKSNKPHVRTTPPTPSPDDWVRDGNRVASSRRQTMLKTRRSKTKASAIPVYHVSLEKAKKNTEDVHMSLSAVKLPGNRKQVVVPPSPPMKNVDSMDLPLGEKSKDSEKAFVVSSSLFEFTEKYNENEVAKPLNRIKVEGAEKESQSKSSTDNKNKKCSSKGSPREYVVPHEFIRQQIAYYKEIDEYELEVEEVE